MFPLIVECPAQEPGMKIGIDPLTQAILMPVSTMGLVITQLTSQNQIKVFMALLYFYSKLMAEV